MGYRTPIVKNVSMDWETEQHSFTFVTLGNKLDALDALRDFIQSIDDLWDYISNEYTYRDELPHIIKVKGNLSGAFSFNGEPAKKKGIDDAQRNNNTCQYP